ncbi:MAG: SH3 domain-containing protein [Cyanobacteriota bacterium]|nr:SH3 domain-containing protein [Cyanobacteriota bacterium]
MKNLITAVAIVAAIAPPVFANPSETQLAQSLVGQCRQVNKQVPVFVERDATSEALRLLPRGTEVTLSGSGEGGFIAINAPEAGFVHTVNLTTCAGVVNPPTAGVCRRVVYPGGLAIRSQPTPNSTYVGGAGYLSRVTLANNPPTTQREANGRIWVQIAEPRAGWVSNGFGSTSNLAYCL